jgi:hypothetical protein
VSVGLTPMEPALVAEVAGNQPTCTTTDGRVTETSWLDQRRELVLEDSGDPGANTEFCCVSDVEHRVTLLQMISRVAT